MLPPWFNCPAVMVSPLGEVEEVPGAPAEAVAGVGLVFSGRGTSAVLIP